MTLLINLKKKIRGNSPDLKKTNNLMENLFKHLSSGEKAINYEISNIEDQKNMNSLDLLTSKRQL